MVGRRAPVRSSARLSKSGAAAAVAAGSSGGGRQARERAAAAAVAAARRARAAERAREVEDSPVELRDKCRRLARALQNAKHLVVYTGAGISTAADIPDYRGPRGVWTRLQRGEAVGRVEVARARPTYTHMALTALWARGALKFVVSQNCDGLHVRAGLPRRALAELHGDMFAERCEPCRRVYLRAFDTTERTARHAHGTRRLCHACGAELRDTIVHFGERGRAAWPLNWAGALRHAAAADVVLCLGSSLKVLRRYPRLWRMHSAPHARPALYIVNLQWTPKDAVAKLKINARCDAVMAQVARRLRLRVPRYSPRRDPLLAHAEPLLPHEAHTTRRQPLGGSASASASPEPSASDSDDEVPLRRLAERMRAEPPEPEPPPPPRVPPPPPLRVPPPPPLRVPPPPPLRVPRPPVEVLPARSPLVTCVQGVAQEPVRCARVSALPGPALPGRVALPDLLHAFQVNMKSGDATILLRAEHAPSAGAPAARASPPPPPPAPRAPSLLRRFRMPRPPRAPPPRAPPPAPPLANGAWSLRRLLHCAPPAPLCAPADERDEKPKVELEGALRHEAKTEMDIDCESKNKVNLHSGLKNGFRAELKPKAELHSEEKTELGGESEAARRGSAAAALAAALIARAVLACRAQLYPGLHSIIAPAAPEPSACAWCARQYAARRCLWYGPPALTPPARRAARRVRARRYLCACCGPGAAPAPAPAAPADDSGWYGKGYRKGRRRPRARP